MNENVPLQANEMTYTLPKQPDPDAIIWRYIDLAKFVDMLDGKCLFFASWAMLKKIDKLEGLFPPKYLRESLDSDFEGVKKLTKADYKRREDILRKGMKAYQHRYFINCWHCDDDESQAMWRLYGSGNQNVVIQSTFQRLQQSLHRISLHHTGLIEYIVHGKDPRKWSAPYKPLFHKDKSLEYEKELRVVLAVDTPKKLAGVSADVNISTLIESIVVSPHADKWFTNVVKSLLKQYGFPNIPVRSSRLSKRPKSL